MDTSYVKTRTVLAIQNIDELCASLGGKLGITREEIPREKARHPRVDHRHLAALENLVDFLRKLDATISDNSKTKKGAK